MIEEKFMRPEHGQLWTEIKDPRDIVTAISTSPKWDENAINIAAM